FRAGARLHQPDAVRELVGRQARNPQSLVGPIVVLRAKLLEQAFQFSRGLPCLVGEPGLESPHKPFRNSVGLRPMPCNQDVDELPLLGQLGEQLGSKVGTPVRNQKLEVGRQQGPQGGDDHRSGHLGAGNKERQLDALTTTIIGDHQDGNPGCDWRTLRQLFSEPLPRRPPGPILAPPSSQDESALKAAHAPAELVGTLSQCAFPSSSAWQSAKLPGGLLLESDRPPGSIFLLALLTDRSPFGSEGRGLLAKQTLLGLPLWTHIRAGWLRWRGRRRWAACRHEGLHCLAVGALRIVERTTWIGWFGCLLAHSFHHQPSRRAADGGQFGVVGGTSNGHKTEIHIQRLAGLLGGAGYRGEAPFFAGVAGVDQREASRRMRLTVAGLTSGIQPLALASSSAMRCLPQVGCCRRSAMTCCSTEAGVRRVVLGARLAKCCKAAYPPAIKRGFQT